MCKNLQQMQKIEYTNTDRQIHESVCSVSTQHFWPTRISLVAHLRDASLMHGGLQEIWHILDIYDRPYFCTYEGVQIKNYSWKDIQ